MRSFVVVSLFTLLLAGCSAAQETKVKQDVVYYVIKHPKIPEYKDTLGLLAPPPPPPPSFYGRINIILTDDTSGVYVHNMFDKNDCGYGRDLSKPPFLNLKTDSLTMIASKDLLPYLKARKWSNFEMSSYTVISSELDSIKNPNFRRIMSFFNSKNFLVYTIRNCTEEERYVLEAKEQNKPYNSDSVEWVEGFDVEFVPPKSKK